MAWKPQRRKWDWRKYLTAEELARIDRMDAAAAKIELARRELEKQFGRERQLIVNRAIQRAKYAALSQ